MNFLNELQEQATQIGHGNKHRHFISALGRQRQEDYRVLRLTRLKPAWETDNPVLKAKKTNKQTNKHRHIHTKKMDFT